MEQPETSGGRGTGRKVNLPDHKDAYPIPDKWRLPFHGHMLTPTAVPSASERQLQIELHKERRKRAIRLGLTVAAVVVVAAGAALLFVLGAWGR